MIRVFFALVVSHLIFLAATLVFGLLVHDQRSFELHFALGLFIALYTCFVHSVIYTYFIATGRIAHAGVVEAKMDNHFLLEQNRLKSNVFRVVMLAAGTMLITIFWGAYITNLPKGAIQNTSNQTIHFALALLATAANIYAYVREHSLIRSNGRLLDELFDVHNQRLGKPGPGTEST